ncbi:hypothetical protein [Hymenobacter crusticola]|uniref:Uncharacterized protein n=1 Tax=Hymenobacter crusticola TaxID=1770526 RepID=A0A243W5Z6_9BACT|nr:hypothetical protein [Hymenobacter crusticola]OUJ68811.1 hypothetical protein BXP70_27325 [Hymenobacter crusticola]
MQHTTAVLAPVHEAASLIARLALTSIIPAPALEDLRELLAKVPPHRIICALEDATIQLVEEGHSPEWPDNGEADAYADLIVSLRRLATLSEASAPLAAAA